MDFPKAVLANTVFAISLFSQIIPPEGELLLVEYV